MLVNKVTRRIRSSGFSFKKSTQKPDYSVKINGNILKLISLEIDRMHPHQSFLILTNCFSLKSESIFTSPQAAFTMSEIIRITSSLAPVDNISLVSVELVSLAPRRYCENFSMQQITETYKLPSIPSAQTSGRRGIKT